MFYFEFSFKITSCTLDFQWKLQVVLWIFNENHNLYFGFSMKIASYTLDFQWKLQVVLWIFNENYKLYFGFLMKIRSATPKISLKFGVPLRILIDFPPPSPLFFSPSLRGFCSRNWGGRSLRSRRVRAVDGICAPRWFRGLSFVGVGSYSRCRAFAFLRFHPLRIVENVSSCPKIFVFQGQWRTVR